MEETKKEPRLLRDITEIKKRFDRVSALDFDKWFRYTLDIEITKLENIKKGVGINGESTT
jgi:hypothetical protein